MSVVARQGNNADFVSDHNRPVADQDMSGLSMLWPQDMHDSREREGERENTKPAPSLGL